MDYFLGQILSCCSPRLQPIPSPWWRSPTGAVRVVKQRSGTETSCSRGSASTSRLLLQAWLCVGKHLLMVCVCVCSAVAVCKWCEGDVLLPVDCRLLGRLHRPDNRNSCKFFSQDTAKVLEPVENIVPFDLRSPTVLCICLESKHAPNRGGPATSGLPHRSFWVLHGYQTHPERNAVVCGDSFH